MTKHRFIVNNIEDSKVDDLVEIANPRQVRQIRKVLRLKPGQEVSLLDDKGTLLNCKIVEMEKDSISVQVTERQELAEDSSVSVSVALAVLKGDKFDWAIQKLTELGVSEIIPIFTERSVIQPANDPSEDQKHSKKYDRWLSISLESVEQSERSRQPKIWKPIEFEQFLTCDKEDSKGNISSFICLARSDAPLLAEHLLNLRDTKASLVIPPKHIRILIGPEGGFTENEIEKALKNNFVECKLGKTILRSETAAIAGATIVTTLTEIL